MMMVLPRWYLSSITSSRSEAWRVFSFSSPPVIKDQQILFRQMQQLLLVTPVGMADIQVIKQPRQPVVHHLDMLLTGLFAQGILTKTATPSATGPNTPSSACSPAAPAPWACAVTAAPHRTATIPAFSARAASPSPAAAVASRH